MDLALTLVGIHTPAVKLKLKIRKTCKFCDSEFQQNIACLPHNYYLIRNAFSGLQKNKVNKMNKKYNSWIRRKIHTDDEPILIF